MIFPKINIFLNLGNKFAAFAVSIQQSCDIIEL